MHRTAILLDPIYKNHTTPHGHPERPERYDAVARALGNSGVMKSSLRIEPRRATTDEIALCHTRDYMQTVEREIAAGYRDLSTGDTAVGPDSLEVALQATGGVLKAVDAVMSKSSANAFCAVRPPGHHATPNRGMGFCIFNNVAIGARYAQKRHGIERVLIADWDVHHGNGTQDIFYQDGSVLFFSTHQYPWYPGTGRAEETGAGAGRGRIVNCPLSAGSGAPEVIGAFRSKLVPVADAFRPDFVLLSAGFDSRAGDPLGRLTLTDNDFVELTELMMEIADKHAAGRLVSVLEGGYNLSGLAAAVSAHVGRLVQ